MGSGLIIPHTVTDGKLGTWLLEIDTGGALLRFAARPVRVTDRLGRTWVYSAGLQPLEVSVDHRLNSVGVQVIDPGIDWAAITARGRHPTRWIADLRYWYEGQTLEEARWVIHGDMEIPEYADPEEAGSMTSTITATPPSDLVMYPPVEAAIDETTWTDDRSGFTQVIDSQSKGTVYPIPIGYPGSGDDDVAPQPAVPAPVAALDGTTATMRMLLSFLEIDAAQVRVWGGDDRSAVTTWAYETENRSVTTDSDDLGQEVYYPNMVGATGNWGFEEGKAYYIGYKNGSGFGGGILWNGEVLRDLGDVLEWALHRSGARYDVDMVKGQKTILSRYKVDTFINTRLQMLKWIDQKLARLFPIRRVLTGRGLWYRHVDWNAPRESVVAVYDVARGDIKAASPVRWSKPVANKLAIEYQKVALNGHHYGRRVLSGSPSGLDTGRQTKSPLCAWSETEWGLLEADPVKTELLWSDSTASQLLLDWAARDAVPLGVRSYSRANFQNRLPGDVVLIQNDPGLGNVEHIAIIDRLRIGGPLEKIYVTLLHPHLRTVS